MNTTTKTQKTTSHFIQHAYGASNFGRKKDHDKAHQGIGKISAVYGVDATSGTLCAIADFTTFGLEIKKGRLICPYGNIGDLLYVRETWALVNGCDYFYKAGFKPNVVFQNVGELKWKPSIHMPKDAARIWLEITGVRVEALQNISSRDAVLEGMPENGQPFVGQFKNLWCKINGVGSWDQNPFVWIVEFKKVTKPCQ